MSVWAKAQPAWSAEAKLLVRQKDADKVSSERIIFPNRGHRVRRWESGPKVKPRGNGTIPEGRMRLAGVVRSFEKPTSVSARVVDAIVIAKTPSELPSISKASNEP
jgi:hypothetical protein